MNSNYPKKEILFARIEAFRSLINVMQEASTKLDAGFKVWYGECSVDSAALQDAIIETHNFLECKKEEAMNQLAAEYKNE